MEAEASTHASPESSDVPASRAAAPVVVPVCSPELELKDPYPEEDAKFSRLSILGKVLPRKLCPCPKDAFLPAELFAQAVLDSGDVPAKAQVQQLFELLPEAAFEFNCVPQKRFSVGLKPDGSLWGSTRAFPLLTTLLAKAVRSWAPDMTFTAISLSLNCQTLPHVDSSNCTAANLVAPITAFTGGGIWIEDPNATTLVPIQGKEVAGKVHELNEGPVIIPAKTKLHCTMPWVGDRLVLVAYGATPSNLVKPSDHLLLKQLHMHLPIQTGTSAPPLACVPVTTGPMLSFLDTAKQRIAGRSVQSLIFLEVFCGTGGLCAAVRKLGMKRSFGVDHHANRAAKCPIVTLDLTSKGSQRILLDLLEGDDVVAIHCAPPCGTCSLARTLPNGPKPLRNSHHPDGLPSLQGVDLQRVTSANALYRLVGLLAKICYNKGILLCIENPARSIFWLVSAMQPCRTMPCESAFLHHCMFGSRRRKATRLMHLCPEMQRMHVSCDGSHEHDPWGRLPDGSFATAAEVHYPPLMCSSMASAFVEQLVFLGAQPVASAMQDATLSLSLASQIAAGKQPPGKKIPPLVPEFSQIVRLIGPAHSLPTVHKGPLSQAFTPPPNVACRPSVPYVPVGSKCIRANPHHGDHKVSPNAADHAGVKYSTNATNFDIAVGLPWTPPAFVKQACLAKHPRCLEKGVPKILSECILKLAVQDVASVAQSRTEQLRKWYCISKEIDETFDGPSHCQQILRSKRVNLFGKMLVEAKHGDSNLAANM